MEHCVLPQIKIYKKGKQIVFILVFQQQDVFSHTYYQINNKSTPESKNAVCTFLDHTQSTFFYLGKFLKKLADDQCSSIIKGSTYHIKHYVTRSGPLRPKSIFFHN